MAEGVDCSTRQSIIGLEMPPKSKRMSRLHLRLFWPCRSGYGTAWRSSVRQVPLLDSRVGQVYGRALSARVFQVRL